MDTELGIELGNLSHVGQVREQNEDYFAYYEYEDPDLAARKGRLAIVADGVGGHVGGFAASRIAVDEVRYRYKDHPGDDPREALKDAIEAANRKIYEQGEEDSEYQGMGTTFTALVFRDGMAYLAHVGDSRAYLIRNGTISQLTRDHSRVARMVEAGMITPEEAEGHPESNVLEQAVGHRDTVDVDISVPPLETRPGDLLLLCSDGLHGLVSDEEMAHIADGPEPNAACQDLVDLANERGGHDNITVQILRVTGPDGAGATSYKSVPHKDGITPVDAPGRRVFTALTALLLMGLGLGAGYLLFGGDREPGKKEGEADQPTIPVSRDLPDQSAIVPDAAPDIWRPKPATKRTALGGGRRVQGNRGRRHTRPQRKSAPAPPAKTQPRKDMGADEPGQAPVAPRRSKKPDSGAKKPHRDKGTRDARQAGHPSPKGVPRPGRPFGPATLPPSR